MIRTWAGLGPILPSVERQSQSDASMPTANGATVPDARIRLLRGVLPQRGIMGRAPSPSFLEAPLIRDSAKC
jgi:hypothetical protein